MKESIPQINEWYIKCPYCGDSNYTDKIGKEYTCTHCKKKFKLKVIDTNCKPLHKFISKYKYQWWLK